MLAGREFEEQDQRSKTYGSSALPVVLNESAARGFFGTGNAIGERLRDEKHSYEVVGVVHDLKSGFAERPSVLYLPLTLRNFARPPAGGMTVIIRSDAGADALRAIRGEIASLDPNLTVFDVRTLNVDVERNRAAERLSIDTYGGIGVFGLVLAAIGLAGITA